jgi:hypothetical protein
MTDSVPAALTNGSRDRQPLVRALNAPHDIFRCFMLGALLLVGLGQAARAAVLFLSSDKQVIKVDSATGAVLGAFTSSIPGATETDQIVVTPSGDFLVSDFGDNGANPPIVGKIFLIDGVSGAVKGLFVAPGVGGLAHPDGMGFGPDGSLYVLDFVSDSQWVIRTYNGTTGAALGAVATINSQTFLTGPVFGPDGLMYVGDATLQNVRRFNLATGAQAGLLLPLNILQGVGALKFAPDGTLYVAVSIQSTTSIDVFNTSGLLLRSSSPTNLARPAAMTFGPDGTLFLTTNEIPPGGIQALSPTGGLTQLVPSSALFVALGITLACDPDVNQICMLDGRFRAEVAWTTQQGTHGVGHPVRYSDATSQFWFFSPDNLEMVVKLINGCSLNQQYWVFAGGLTDVAMTMTVTDTQTGRAKVYKNPQSTAFKPIQDTSALPTCP